MEVVDADDLIVITDQGVLTRQPVSQIRTIGRVTQGVKLVKLDGGTKISSISRVINNDDRAVKTPKEQDPDKDNTAKNENISSPEETREQVYNAYRDEFDMFGYSKYLKESSRAPS